MSTESTAIGDSSVEYCDTTLLLRDLRDRYNDISMAHTCIKYGALQLALTTAALSSPFEMSSLETWHLQRLDLPWIDQLILQ